MMRIGYYFKTLRLAIDDPEPFERSIRCAAKKAAHKMGILCAATQESGMLFPMAYIRLCGGDRQSDPITKLVCQLRTLRQRGAGA